MLFQIYFYSTRILIMSQSLGGFLWCIKSECMDNIFRDFLLIDFLILFILFLFSAPNIGTVKNFVSSASVTTAHGGCLSSSWSSHNPSSCGG